MKWLTNVQFATRSAIVVAMSMMEMKIRFILCLFGFHDYQVTSYVSANFSWICSRCGRQRKEPGR